MAAPTPCTAAGGEWRVERPRISWPILDAVRDAAAEVGIPKIDDFNRGDNEGSDYFEVNQRRGRRWSAARGFLKPVLSRRNSTCHRRPCERLISRAAASSAVRYYAATAPTSRRARDGEIVLAAGAIGTPQLLELSGIGRPETLLAESAWPIVARAAGGRRKFAGPSAIAHHLQDRGRAHAQRRFSVAMRSAPGWALEYALKRRGPMTMAPSQLGIFAKSSPDYATANLEFHVQPLSLDKFGEPLHRFPAITLSVCNLRPASRGNVHAGRRRSRAAPAIQPNYLSRGRGSPRRRRIRSALRGGSAAAPALARFTPEEYLPGAPLQSEEELAQAAGDIGTTIFHPVGTAKMGARRRHDRGRRRAPAGARPRGPCASPTPR